MNTRIRFLLSILLLCSAVLSACAPQAVSQPPAAAPSPETPPAEPPAGKLPASSPLAGLMAALSGAGIPVQFSGPGDGSLLDSDASYLLNSSGTEILVYEFASPDDAAAASARFSPDGGTITGLDGSLSSVRWIAPPHFWLSGSFIVQYLGDDAGLLGSLESALGKPFSGAGLAAPAEDFSRLWREVRQAGTGVGFAVPCWWHVDELPAEGALRSQTMRSYDEAFFGANSVKGEWKDGVWPDGAYKLDLTIVEPVDPSLTTIDAYRKLTDPSMEQVLENTDLQLGGNTWTEARIKSVLRPEEPAGKVYLLRLAPDRLLIAAAYPFPGAIDAGDVQAILSSFAASREQAITLPKVEPHAPLSPASCAE